MNLLATLLLIAGAVLLVLAAWGVIALPDALARQHAATKAGTLALVLVCLGAALAMPAVAQDVIVATPIAVSTQRPGARADFIPYTDKPIRWHTDGYYHPQSRRIEGMVLHCVRAAGEGGISGLVDHDRVYIALRDANPAWVRALMAPDAMTIPERADDNGVARPAQSGPVFSVLTGLDGEHALHMRYTARTRSIAWKDEPDTRAAVAFLEQWLSSDAPWIFRLRLLPGMGLVCNNVPHERSAFTDDPQRPRLLYRARYLDRVGAPPAPHRHALQAAQPELQL